MTEFMRHGHAIVDRARADACATTTASGCTTGRDSVREESVVQRIGAIAVNDTRDAQPEEQIVPTLRALPIHDRAEQRCTPGERAGE